MKCLGYVLMLVDNAIGAIFQKVIRKFRAFVLFQENNVI